MKLTTASQILTSIAWIAVLAAAILIKEFALPPGQSPKGNNIEVGLLLMFLFMTVGIRLVPGFRQGLVHTIRNFFSGEDRSGDCIETETQKQNGTTTVIQDLESGVDISDKKADETEKTEIVERVVNQPGQGTSKATSSPRVYFLDWIKVFLTAVVVVHHVVCAFKEVGSMPISIGIYDNKFAQIAGYFTGLNQGYFMPLFFFISAYFVPKSYDKKGGDTFLYERALRLLLPGLLVMFVIYPLANLVAQVTAGIPTWYTGYSAVQSPLVLSAGPAWFILWLLIFSFAYHTFRLSYSYAEKKSCKAEAGGNNEDTRDNTEASVFPCWWKRMLAGATICGLFVYAFKEKLIGGYSNFYQMPIYQGSATADVLFFAVGVYASRQNWMASPILPSWASWIFICIAAPLEFLLAAEVFSSGESLYPPVVGYLFWGMYCVDMSTLMLALFQRFLNFKPGKFGQFLSDSAYAVYLIHPVVLTCWTAVFVKVYNSIYGEVIVFGGFSEEFGMPFGAVSFSPLLGPSNGSLALFLACGIVSVLTLLTVWPIAYGIRSLPFLNQIL